MSFGPHSPLGAGPIGFAGLRRSDDEDEDPPDDECPCPDPRSHLIEAVAVAAVAAVVTELAGWGIEEVRERIGKKDDKKKDDKKDGSSG